jgi:DNA-binding CsgD family transcriptional regulator
MQYALSVLIAIGTEEVTAIIDHLKISHHTVRNIRQRMFEKYNVNNSIELLNKAV